MAWGYSGFVCAGLWEFAAGQGRGSERRAQTCSDGGSIAGEKGVRLLGAKYCSHAGCGGIRKIELGVMSFSVALGDASNESTEL